MKDFTSVIIPIIFGLILGSIFGWLIINTRYNAPDTYHIYLDILYTSGGHTMYWSNDTIWGDENYTSFLKVYPRKLLESKKIIGIK